MWFLHAVSRAIYEKIVWQQNDKGVRQLLQKNQHTTIKIGMLNGH